jgi:hypothetical protein
MKTATIAERRLIEMFGSRGKDFASSLVVENQAVIRLTLQGTQTSEWQEITRRVEAVGGCWEQSEKAWKIPCFISRLDLPTPSKRFNSRRLHVRPLTLQNLIFSHDTFGDRPPTNWKDIQAVLSCLRSNRKGRKNAYSKAECRDYLGALLALQTHIP